MSSFSNFRQQDSGISFSFLLGGSPDVRYAAAVYSQFRQGAPVDIHPGAPLLLPRHLLAMRAAVPGVANIKGRMLQDMTEQDVPLRKAAKEGPIRMHQESLTLLRKLLHEIESGQCTVDAFVMQRDLTDVELDSESTLEGVVEYEATRTFTIRVKEKKA